MSEKENNEEIFDEYSEAEKYEMEQIMIEMAFENSYKIITKQTTFEKLLDAKGSGEKAILIYDPVLGWGKNEVEDLIYYFEENEEYEKCAKLKKILDVQL
jgi:hypothetical protein